MTESLVSKANREKLEAEKYALFIEMAKEGINTAVEQGLWIMLMIDMGALTGQVDKTSFLGQQRKALAELMDVIAHGKNFSVGPLEFKMPGLAVFGFFAGPMQRALEKTTYIEGKGDVYTALDPIPRLMCTFMLPGMLKLVASQLGEIVPG